MNDKDAPVSEWADLTAVWVDPQATPAPDTPALVRAVRRRARLARLNFMVEIATGLALIAVVGVLAVLGRLSLSLAAAAAAFALFALGLTLWARRGLEKDGAATPEQALRLALSQARAGLQWGRAGLAVTAAAAVYMAYVLNQSGDGSQDMRVTLVLAAVFLGGCAMFYARHARRSRQRMQAHARALTALTSPEPGDQADRLKDSTASDARPPDTTSPPPMA